jgi:DNA invertase Pin-like site-specific DNA recombinase
MIKIAIYARVSTDKQSVDMQLHELRNFVQRSGWSVYAEFVDQGMTGGNLNRPAFKNMMEDARRRKFDILLVWKLDRLGRSLKDLVNTLDTLGHYNVGFMSYSDKNLDTTTPSGKLLFQIMASVAEFEKDIIRERVVAGLAEAKRKGKRLGRAPVETDIVEQGLRLRAAGVSYRKIGKELGISEGVVRHRLNPPVKPQ